jgi:enoyl-CoA hydratase/carnithine racemase
MGYQQILYDVSDRIAIITLNRPDKLNAWTTIMEREVRAAMVDADRDDDVRAIILTGAGRGFCAGADMQDLSEVASAGSSIAEVARNLREKNTPATREGVRADFQRRYSYFPTIGKPVIAAVNGPVAGLGFVMMLYCDLRFASEEARFSTSFARRGLIAEHGISWLLPRIVGPANAMDLLFSARLVDAAEAQRMGLVNNIFAPAALHNETRAYAAQLAGMVSPRSIRIMKRQVWNALFETLDQAIEVADEEMFRSFDTEDFREGVAHFLEKRAPVFAGR